MQVAQILPNGVGGAAIPVGRLVGLLGGQNLDEAIIKRIELIGIADMTMQTDAEKLRQDVNAFESAVDAIAEGNVDESILAGDGHGRLTAVLGQRIQRRAASAAENEADNVLHVPSPPRIARPVSHVSHRLPRLAREIRLICRSYPARIAPHVICARMSLHRHPPTALQRVSRFWPSLVASRSLLLQTAPRVALQLGRTHCRWIECLVPRHPDLLPH